MNNNNNYNNDNNQFILSYELLYLLQWLAENEAEALKKMITRAFKKGFQHPLGESQDYIELELSETMQQSIVDFLGLLDMLLVETSNEQGVRKVLHRNMLPVINQIDAKQCDEATVELSLEKTTSRINQHPEQNPQEILFKELLKRWKPQKKTVMN